MKKTKLGQEIIEGLLKALWDEVYSGDYAKYEVHPEEARKEFEKLPAVNAAQAYLSGREGEADG